MGLIVSERRRLSMDDNQEASFTNSHISLEKIDILRERLGVSYNVAKNSLDTTNGNVIEALVMLEKEQENKKDIIHGLHNRISSILSKGNTTKVRIKKEGKTVAEIPATVGAVGLVTTLAYTPLAIMGALGSVTAMLNQYTLEVEKEDGEVTEHPIVEVDATDDN